MQDGPSRAGSQVLQRSLGNPSVAGSLMCSETSAAGLASLVTNRDWPPSGPRAKMRKFGKDHPRLHKLLVHKLDELHRFHAPK